MRRECAGRGLMTAGLIVIGVGLIIVAVRELHIPRLWIPVIVGAALFLAGALRWLTTERRPKT
jgi:hypothetical protein